VLQGTRLSRALLTNPPSVVREYVTANREGQAWLRRFCAEHGVAVQERPAWTHATTRLGELRARAEYAAARDAGLDVTWEVPDLPFETRGGVRLGRQFQLHPRELTDALVAEYTAHGGVVHERSRMLGLERRDDGVHLAVDGGATVVAPTVVLATSQPVTWRGGFFGRLQARRSYAAALRAGWSAPGMYLSADAPTRSLRSVPSDGGELLLVGGEGHVTGRAPSPQQHLDELLAWARDTFDVTEVVATWSAQDQAPVTGLPYVGPALPGQDDVLVATGYDKWGFTNAPAAALALAAHVMGESPSWARALRSWTPRELAGLPRALGFNGTVGWELAGGWARKATRRTDAPVCTHLGGVLCWNDAEETWDCPLHGSRFDADGSVLEGPATRPLPSIPQASGRGNLRAVQ